tara:strand:+ start:1652 stop:1894 length:243 start_codon:yes stop_codon:yes gene_type:complete
MSEIKMGIIEQLAELIMSQMEFKGERELTRFANELKNELLSLYDPDFKFSESESSDETDDDGEAEEVKVLVDKDGFMKLE